MRVAKYADVLALDIGVARGEIVPIGAGTTFKALPPEDKADLTADKAIGLMVTNPSMIKRPVLDVNGRTTVGFKPEIYAALFV
ncbi:MAG: hypothetical protein EOP20_04180 [Hyphomicrobiales bacterium]|nr:MAG: hypothetical protein EOP20_04180 [Hyphomicrobiales bacterium]